MTGKQLLTFLRNYYNIKIFERNLFYKKTAGREPRGKSSSGLLGVSVVAPAVAPENQRRDGDHRNADHAGRGQAIEDSRSDSSSFQHICNEHAHSHNGSEQDGEEGENLFDGHSPERLLEHRSSPFWWKKGARRDVAWLRPIVSRDDFLFPGRLRRNGARLCPSPHKRKGLF